MMDLKLVDGDVAFDSSGKLETVTGGEAVAQSLVTVLSYRKGSFFWAPDAGLGLVDALGSADPNPDDIGAKAEDLMYEDPRIDAESICVSASAEAKGSESALKVTASFSTIEGDDASVTVEGNDA
jgi:hypothetical protein